MRRSSRRLTARERSILLLAAHGRTNREIADALDVSEKTVEGHLWRAYKKLGINGRPDLEALEAWSDEEQQEQQTLRPHGLEE